MRGHINFAGVMLLVAALVLGFAGHGLLDSFNPAQPEKVTVRFGLQGESLEMTCVDEAWVEDRVLHVRDGANRVGFADPIAWRIEPCAR